MASSIAAMNLGLRALRGATTFERDEGAHVTERVVELVTLMMQRNDLNHDQIISMLLTATNDLHSIFPATAVRTIGFGDVPMMCAQELDIVGATPQCVRVLMHIASDIEPSALRHVYLHGAAGLRDDLPE
jgi:chorismate mutase